MGSVTPIISAGITVRRDDFDACIDNISKLESQPLDDEGMLPSDISQIDGADLSFELVSDISPPNKHLGPSLPLPKLRPCEAST